MAWWTEAELEAIAPVGAVDNLPAADSDAIIARIQTQTEEDVAGMVPPDYTIPSSPVGILKTCALQLAVNYLVGQYPQVTQQERDYAAQLFAAAERKLDKIARGLLSPGLTKTSRTKIATNQGVTPERHTLGVEGDPGTDDEYVLGWETEEVS